MSWIDGDEERLKTMWGEGLSASQIAAALDWRVTRSAVIGKIHRLGLVGRGRATQPKNTAHKYLTNPPQPSKPKPPTFFAPRVEEEPATPPVPFATVEHGHCKFPTWPDYQDPPPNPECCGRKTVVGSYCLTHARRVFTPAGLERKGFAA
jgi:GcrA cell cycle regulator